MSSEYAGIGEGGLLPAILIFTTLPLLYDGLDGCVAEGTLYVGDRSNAERSAKVYTYWYVLDE